MTDKVLCPWCGSEMVVAARWHWNDADDRERVWNAWTKCNNEDCGSDGPYALDRPTEEEAINAAYDAALRRYEPPIRPMTLDEIKSHTKAQDAAPVWLDDIEEMSNTGWTYSHIISDWLHGFDERTYGKEWRCWPRKPTDEERKEAKWDD